MTPRHAGVTPHDYAKHFVISRMEGPDSVDRMRTAPSTVGRALVSGHDIATMWVSYGLAVIFGFASNESIGLALIGLLLSVIALILAITLVRRPSPTDKANGWIVIGLNILGFFLWLILVFLAIGITAATGEAGTGTMPASSEISSTFVEPACIYCNDKGSYLCAVCANGVMDCAMCVSGVTAYASERCSFCDGTGSITCTICNGSGLVDCTFCES